MRKFEIPDELPPHIFTEIFTRKIGGITFHFGVYRWAFGGGLRTYAWENTTNNEYAQRIFLCPPGIFKPDTPRIEYEWRYIPPWICKRLVPYLQALQEAADIWEIRHNN